MFLNTKRRARAGSLGESSDPLPSPPKFTEEQLEIFIAKLNTSLQAINTKKFGKFAKIYNTKIGPEQVAIKMYNQESQDDKNIRPEYFADELRMMKHLVNHPYFVQYLCHSVSQKSIVMEWTPHGDLDDYIQKNRTNFGSSTNYPSRRITLLHNTLQAIVYLHHLNILHKDIKPQNILIFENDTIKLCDFNLSVTLSPGQKKFTSEFCPGTAEFIAPESIKTAVKREGEYSYASDLWAFAMVVWMMYSLDWPYSDIYNVDTNYNLITLLSEIYGGKTPDEKKITDEPVQKLVVKLWNMAPSLRPTGQEALKVFEEVRQGLR